MEYDPLSMFYVSLIAGNFVDLQFFTVEDEHEAP